MSVSGDIVVSQLIEVAEESRTSSREAFLLWIYPTGIELAP
jgi:hypothetical protein